MIFVSNHAAQLLDQPRFLSVIFPVKEVYLRIVLHTKEYLGKRPEIFCFYLAQMARRLLEADKLNKEFLNFCRNKNAFFDFTALPADKKVTRKQALEIQKTIGCELLLLMKCTPKYLNKTPSYWTSAAADCSHAFTTSLAKLAAKGVADQCVKEVVDTYVTQE